MVRLQPNLVRYRGPIAQRTALKKRSPYKKLRRFQTASVSAEAPDAVPEVPFATLRHQFICAAIPMIGFGFMDNSIMIHAGDLIDTTIGAKFGLAMLAAAGIGQIFSDASGVAFGGFIDDLAGKKFLPPEVTAAQRNTRRFRMATTSGALLGVLFGCCLGMCNLLFIDLGKREREENRQALSIIFETVMKEGPDVFDCDVCSLFLYDPKEKALFTKSVTNDSFVELPLDAPGICTEVYHTQKPIRVDSETDPRVNRKSSFLKTKTMLAYPIVLDGHCLGVIETINKKHNNIFSEDDEQKIKMMSFHMGLFMKTLDYVPEEGTEMRAT